MGGEQRRVGWVSRHTAVCVGSVLCSQLAPGLGPSGWVVSPVLAQPWDGGGPRAQRVTALNWNLRPGSAARLLFLLGHSVPPRSLRRQPVVGKWAGAHGSLDQRKWLVGPRPACSVHMVFLWPQKGILNVSCPFLLSLQSVGRQGNGWGYWAPGDDACDDSGLQVGMASEATVYAPPSCWVPTGPPPYPKMLHGDWEGTTFLS